MKYVVVVVLVLLGIVAHAQCGLDMAHTIVDLDNDKADTTNVAILVSGALNDDLSTSNQGVCGVQLRFRHPFMKELFIELISPSGQVVQLTGGDIIPTNTQLITWDVTFVPCGAAAAPDFGFSAIWENHQNWQNLTTYRGQYYPHSGCLEDFNLGSVNGVWTIRGIDFSDGGQGILQDAKIIFCNDEGVSCSPCQLNPGTILNEDIIACKGSSALLISIDKDFPEHTYDTSIYYYTNVVFGEDTIVGYYEDVDLTAFDPGNYRVCALQIAAYQRSLLPLPGSVFNHNTLESYFLLLGACGGLSEKCLQIVIEDPPPAILEVRYICSGEKVVMDGKEFDETGVYDIVIKKEPCDSLITLDLKVINLEAIIDAESETIGCTMQSLFLEGNYFTEYDGAIKYFWYSPDGQIESDIYEQQVSISREGTYYLEVTIESADYICKDTTSVVIVKDLSFPEISFLGDTEINCYKDTVTITANVSVPLASVHWISENGDPFLGDNQHIKIWNAGKYFLEIMTMDGCYGLDSFVIIEDKVVPLVQINHGVINCKDTLMTIMTVPQYAGNYTYNWSGVDPPFKEVQNPEIRHGGSYTLTMTNGDNGCSTVSSITVIEDKTPPVIEAIQVDTLNCKRTSVLPRVIPNLNIGAYHWTGIGLNTTATAPAILSPGSYQVVVTSAQNFCTQNADFDVIGDYDLPIITVSVDSITCLVDSVQLITESNVDLIDFSWGGPGFFSSTILSPFVYREGIYNLKAEGSNGCPAVVQIEVINSRYKPEIKIISDSIRCDRDTIILMFEPDVPDRSYLWSGPGLLSNVGPHPMVNQPGIYTVTVTNDVTGCTYETDFTIEDARIYSAPSIQVPILDCAHDSVRITLANQDIQSVVFWGDGFYSESLTPYIDMPGKYFVQLTNTHHCITVDSFQVHRDIEIPDIQADFKSIQCGQDSIVLKGISSLPGTVFSWSSPDGFSKSGPSVYAYQGGNYQVLGTAPNGCKMIYEFELGYDTIRPVFNILPPDILTCRQPVITLSTDFDRKQGTIIWVPNGSTDFELSVNQPGVYIAVVEGMNHCLNSDTIEVFSNKLFPSFDVLSSTINCQNLSATIEVIPNTDYTDVFWSAGNPQSIADQTLIANVANGGIYRWVMVNEEGCETEGSVEVLVDTIPPTIDRILVDTLNCFHPKIDIGVIVDGDILEYVWNGPSFDNFVTRSGMIQIQEAGNYTVQIIGTNYCRTSTSMDILRDDDLPEYRLLTDTLTCRKGKVSLGVESAEVGLQFKWQGPDGFASNQRYPIVFSSGTYYIEILGANGCLVLDSLVVLEINEKPEISIADTLYLPCDLEAIELEVSSESTLAGYYWTYPDGHIVNTPTTWTATIGRYGVQAEDAFGCVSDVKLFEVLLDATVPQVSFDIDTITCKNPTAELAVNVDPLSDFIWLTPSGLIETASQIRTSESGVFFLITSNDSGCKDTNTVFVPIDISKPFVAVDLLGEILCSKADVILDGSGSNFGNPFTSLWTVIDGNIDGIISEHAIHVNQAGNYRFEVTDLKNGCTNDAVIEVEETPSNFTEFDVTATPPYCDQVINGTIQINDLNGTPPYVIELNGVDVLGQRYFEGLRVGTYTFRVTDANGCTLQKQVDVPRNESLNIDVATDILIFFGDSVTILPSLNNHIFGDHRLQWFVGDSLICDGCTELTVQPFVNTVYVIEHTIDGLCKEKISVLVRVNRNLNNAVPNIFNPSSTLGNDKYYIPQIRGITKIKRLLIFDKWAENVYSAYDILPGISDLGWDGTFRGQLCASGVYIVIAEFELSNGKTWTYRGDLTLIR
ncbi:MAG: gliding motility-associated C-terminal domain-containing protein [Chitinophagales bacterium]|nr:gliding motility-associated C-terminal domain-containing protein [Chitinophagales bacterium]